MVPATSNRSVAARLPREKGHFVIPRPVHTGASGPETFKGKRFVPTGVFPEVGGGGGLNMGKDRVKDSVVWGTRNRFDIRKDGYFIVGKQPGMSKVSQARSRPNMKLLTLHDLKLGLDAGCNQIEEFEASKREARKWIAQGHVPHRLLSRK